MIRVKIDGIAIPPCTLGFLSHTLLSIPGDQESQGLRLFLQVAH